MSDLQKQMIEFSTMDLVDAVAKERKLSPVAAMAVVYKSPFYRKLQDPETGLYRESSSYLLNLFNAKRKGRTVRKLIERPMPVAASETAGDEEFCTVFANAVRNLRFWRGRR